MSLPEAGSLEALLSDGVEQLGLPLDQSQQSLCLAYLALLQQWGRVYNLTAVLEPRAMVSHHLLDCLAVISPLKQYLAGRGGEAGARVLDAGSGAGLPGLMIALLCPDVQVVCVDAVAKKVAFVQQAALALGLSKLRAIHGRVEDLKEPAFDLVTSRAFASLSDFVQRTRFHVKPYAVWMAMKGRAPDAELSQLAADISVIRVQPLQVPHLDAERCLVWLQKRESL